MQRYHLLFILQKYSVLYVINLNCSLKCHLCKHVETVEVGYEYKKCHLPSCPLAFIKLKCFPSFGHVNTRDVKSFLTSDYLKCSP